MPRPAVGVQRGDDYLPDMTPAEAVALAAALVQAAWRIEPGAVEAIAAPDAARRAPDSCPSWCAYGPHGPGDDVHISEGHAVPAASPRHISRYTTGAEPVDSCEHDICAELVLSDDGVPEVRLHHGYGGDEMPSMTLGAAEALAWKILGPGCVARMPALSTQD